MLKGRVAFNPRAVPHQLVGRENNQKQRNESSQQKRETDPHVERPPLAHKSCGRLNDFRKMRVGGHDFFLLAEALRNDLAAVTQERSFSTASSTVRVLRPQSGSTHTRSFGRIVRACSTLSRTALALSLVCE